MSDLVSISNWAAPEAPWSISRKEIIAADPARVWRALTEPAELTRWWCNHAEIDLRAGGRYSFGGPYVFGGGAGGRSSAEGGAGAAGFEIIEVIPEERLEFTWPLAGVQTQCAYELVNSLEQTELTATQIAGEPPGWEADAESPNWWWVALPALRSLVETGQPDLRLDYAAAAQAAAIELRVEVFTFPWIIWHKLTDPGELGRWWGKKAEVDLRPGGKYLLGGEGAGPRQVLEAEPGKRLVHDWLGSGGTLGRIEWTIDEGETSTALTLRDLGPWDPGARRDALAIRRASTILALKQMSERGITPREYQGF